MRNMPAIIHGKENVYEALGLGDTEVVAKTVNSYLAYASKTWGIETRSEVVEALCRAVETDEVMRRIICLLATDLLEKIIGGEITKEMGVSKTDETPLHYALRTRFGLEPEEVETVIAAMKDLVRHGEDPKKVIAKAGLTPGYAEYLK